MSYSKALCCPPSDCYPEICPRPWIDVWNEPCVTSCGDSTAVVFAPPVCVRFPGPTLATCPQESFVGTSIPYLAGGPGGFPGSGVGSRGPFTAKGSSSGVYAGGYNGGSGGGYVYGSGFQGGYGGSCRYGRKLYGSRSVCGGQYSGYKGRNCGPC